MLGGMPGEVSFEVVPTDSPPLLGQPALKKMKAVVYYDNEEPTKVYSRQLGRYLQTRDDGGLLLLNLLPTEAQEKELYNPEFLEEP